MDNSDLAKRMKSYESSYQFSLTPRMPIILRIDGCHFHTYTKKFDKPWDPAIRHGMIETSAALVKQISGAEFAYTQSDEISILINTYKKFNTQPWFDSKLSKAVSVSASIATAAFNKAIAEFILASGITLPKSPAIFDSRAFVVPREDVVNYFYWRELDCIRNSVSSLAQANFSHKQLNNKSCKDMKLMLKEIGKNWDELPDWDKYGICLCRVVETSDSGAMRSKIYASSETPIFSKDSLIIEKALEQEEK